MGRRIIQIVQHLAPGGIETMVLDLKGFAAPDDEVLIVSLEGERYSSCSAWPRLAPHAAALLFMDKAPGVRLGLVADLVALLRRFRPDVVHTHHIGPLLYGGIAARLAGVPTVIHTEHDAWHLNEPRRRRVERLALFLVRPHLVADAGCVAALLQRAVPHCAPIVIRNGIDTQRFAPAGRRQAQRCLGLPEGVPMVGCAARLIESKGHAVLLRAVAALDADVHLALAGAGPQESALRQLTHELGLEARVHFLGRLDDMPTFYQALDVFCLPSFAEGMPLSPLEAQACGVPAVVSDVGGAAEVICPHTGRLVPAGDVQALARALGEVLNEGGPVSPREFVVRTADVRTMVQAYNHLAVQA